MTEIEWINIFGDNLRDIIKDHNSTQREIADAAGLSESCISDYIRKRSMPSIRSIINLSYALDCDVSELIDFGDRII